MPKYNSLQLFREILQDPERKDISLMAKEFLQLSIRYKEPAIHYFTRHLYKQDVENPYDYFPNHFLSKVPPAFNDRLYKQALDDKLYFNLLYNRPGVRLPRLIAFNNKHSFTSGDSIRIINSVEDFSRFLKELFRQNPGCSTFFLKKSNASSGGKSIHILSAESAEKTPAELEDIFIDVVGSSFIIQEQVRQHPDMNRLNPSSLNTVRIDTFLDREDKVEVLSAMLKMSTNGVPVDNLSMGGCSLGIDLETGSLRKTARAKMKFYGTRVFTEHPVTGIKFEGYKIPFIDEAVQMVTKAAQIVPALRLVGWDVGIGEDGPIVIEGNSDYGISSNDLAYGGYRTNKTFIKILQELNDLK